MLDLISFGRQVQQIIFLSHYILLHSEQKILCYNYTVFLCSDWSITWIYNVYKWLFILVFEGMWPLCEFHNGFCCQRAQRCRDFTLIIIWWSWWKKWGQYTGLATFGWRFRQWVQPCHCQEDSQPLTPLLTSQSLTHNRLCTCFTMLL